MKKKLIILLALVCMLVACVPAFSGCKGKREYTLKEDEQGNKYYSVNYSGFSSSLKGSLEIPEYYGEGESRYPVKEIAQEGFAGTNITSVTIPKTVEKIGNAAFAHNYQLANVTFAEGTTLTKIPRGTFGFCQSLRSIEIPETVTEIGAAAFLHCEKLSVINMPANLEKINEQAFESCFEIKEVTFPQTLKFIGERAYYNTGLKSVVIPDGVADVVTTDGEGKEKVERALGYGAFHTCLSLETATVGAGIKQLPAGMFGSCTALKEVRLTSNLTMIEGAVEKNGDLYCGHAFFGCSSLTDVYYSGSKTQWDALKNNINNSPYKVNNVTYNNNPVLNAAMHYGQ